MKPDFFQELLEQYGSKRIAVIGDFILDEYIVGDTKRVSREAPVVVIDYRESLYHPGGAANAAQNVASLGASPLACGVLGDDREGAVLAEVLQDRGADTSLLQKDARITTAVKTRIMAGELHAQKQQIARIDKSECVPARTEGLESLARELAGMISGVDAVLFSDYGLGVTTDSLSRKVIDSCTEKRIPVVVDSRFRLLEFDGATVATPNEVELFDALKLGTADEHRLEAMAAQVIRDKGFDGLIVTRGSKGMKVCRGNGVTESVGIVGSSDVTDVTGAGDTVAATVALSLACGSSLEQAAEMATYAAAVVVMKRGTATVNRQEMEAIRAEYPKPHLGGAQE